MPDIFVNVTAIVGTDKLAMNLNTKKSIKAIIIEILKATDNLARKSEDWKVFLNNNEIDSSKSLDFYNVKDGDEIELSVKRGGGGQ